MRRNPVRQMATDNGQMGSIFDDLKEKAGVDLDPGSAIESFAKSTGQKYLPTSIYEKAEQLAESKGQALLDKQYAALKTQATEAAMKKAQDLMSQKEYRDKGISSAVQATAEQVSKELIGIKDAWRTGGIMSVFSKYPYIKYSAYGMGGLMSILLLKFIIGKKRVKVVQATANPKSRRKRNPKRAK